MAILSVAAFAVLSFIAIFSTSHCTLHLVVTSLLFPLTRTVPMTFVVFCDPDICEEPWPVDLQNAR